jgi:hypothetical protein
MEYLNKFESFEELDQNIKILAKFFSGEKYQNDPDIDILFSLQDEWDKIYNENRIKKSFSAARTLANEHILHYILKN